MRISSQYVINISDDSHGSPSVTANIIYDAVTIRMNSSFNDFKVTKKVGFHSAKSFFYGAGRLMAARSFCVVASLVPGEAESNNKDVERADRKTVVAIKLR